MHRTLPRLVLVSLLGCTGGGLKTADQLGQGGGTPVDCSTNSRPTLTWVEVEDGATHPGEVPIALAVGDDRDPPEDLVVAWSTLAGPGEALSVDPDGTLLLPTDGLALGRQELTVQVTDSCGSSTATAIAPCLQGELHEPDLDFTTLRLTRDAVVDATNGWLDLTPAASAQVGTAFDEGHIAWAGQVSVRIEFTLGGDPGGDGLSITALDVDRREFWNGGGGCGLGYGVASDCDTGAALPGWSVELDTHGNDHDPVDGPHVAFTYDGNLDSPVAWSPIPDVGGLGWHELALELADGELVVRLDGAERIRTEVDPERVDFPAFLGFTAGTGVTYQLHRLRTAEVRHLACLP